MNTDPEIIALNSTQRAARIKELNRVACGTACFIMHQEREGCFLAIRRQAAHGAGTWSVPGGWVDAGEHPRDAITRECWEEVAISLVQPLFIGYTFDQHPEGIEDICLWFKAYSWTGEPRVAHPDKVDAVRWVTESDLPSPLFLPLSQYLERWGCPA